MVSSTQRDLIDYRARAREMIWIAEMYPLAMERSAAISDSDAILFSLKMVDEADIYLGIFGLRYGYIPQDERNPERVSITEMEYRRAVERKIPRLIFILEDKKADSDTIVEEDEESRKKLEALKAE